MYRLKHPLQAIKIKRQIILINIIFWSLLSLAGTLLVYVFVRLVILQEDASALLLLIAVMCYASERLIILRSNLALNFKL